MKLDRQYFVGMWLTGEEAAKFAVASGLTNSEREFLDEEYIHEDVLHWEAWSDADFKTRRGNSRQFNCRDESVVYEKNL